MDKHSTASRNRQPSALAIDLPPQLHNGALSMAVRELEAEKRANIGHAPQPAPSLVIAGGHANTAEPLTQTRASSIEERLGRAAAGALLLWGAYTFQSAAQLPTHPYLAPLSLVLYIGGFIGFLSAAVATPFSITRQRSCTWLLIGFVLVSVTLNAYAAIAIQNPRYGTDGIALAHLAVQHALSGANPYAYVPDASELLSFGVPISAMTQTTFGQFIPNALSYPALSFLDFVPFFAIGIHDLRWVVLIFELASLAVIATVAPERVKLWALIAIVADTNLSIYFAGGSVIDWIWVLPLLLMIVCLCRRHPLAAAVCFGLAAATKQQSWFVTPFLAVWLYNYWATSPRPVRNLANFFIVSLLVFLAPNLPFLFRDSHAWLSSVTAPLFQPPDGQGLSILGQFSLIKLSEATYSAIFAGASLIIWVGYVLYGRSAPSAAWILPAVVLWFSHRSFQSYFVYWTPIFILGLVLERHLQPLIPEKYDATV